MSDIVLKIYSTTTTWADTLDHTIFGDVLDYSIVDNSNYTVDTAYFVINDEDKRWSDQITPDFYSGTWTTQVWRAFTRADKLIGSGIIKNVRKENNTIVLDCVGMTEILKKKVVEDEFFQTLDNAGAAVTGDYILTNATYGLLPKYLSTDYGTLDYSTYVDSPSSGQERVWKFDGVSLYDACVDVARGCYGTNSNSFDAYLFETYVSATGVFTLNLYFREIDSQASSKTITISDVYLPSFNLSEHSTENYSRVVVRGEMNPNTVFPDNDVDVLSDTVGDWDFNDEGSGGVLTTNTICHYGDVAIQGQRGSETERVMIFNDNAGSGISGLDSRLHRIRFYGNAQFYDTDRAVVSFFVCLGIKDKYGNVSSVDVDSKSSLLNYECKLVASAQDEDIEDGPGGVWYDIPLPKPSNANGWDNHTDTFANSGLQFSEWKEIYQVGFLMDDDSGEEIINLLIDGLHFVGNSPFTGAYPTSSSARDSDYIYTDQGLKSNTDCANMARNILTGLNQIQYSGTIQLTAVKRDFSLKAGDSVEVVIPIKGINIQSGETVTKLPIQQIVYTPAKQILTLGRVYTNDELVNRIARKTRLNRKGT